MLKADEESAMNNLGKHIFKGLRFGLLLQAAIGPVCLFVLKTAAESGVGAAEAGVAAVTLIDALFVTLAIVGIGSIIEKPGVKTFLKYFGAAMLLYFGAGVILGSFGIQIVPGLNPTLRSASSAFVTCLVITVSNPLTVLFWTGVFATRIVSEGFGRREMILFGAGAVLATMLFLGILALIVGSVHLLLNEKVIKVLNVMVGLVLLGFGIKMLFTKRLVSPSGGENEYRQ
jgi:threonine/homoserine/homoserine lactone efflux protein